MRVSADVTFGDQATIELGGPLDVTFPLLHEFHFQVRLN